MTNDNTPERTSPEKQLSEGNVAESKSETRLEENFAEESIAPVGVETPEEPSQEEKKPETIPETEDENVVDKLEKSETNEAVAADSSASDDSQIHVCVTGASGFVASHCIYQLLQNPNYIVHATVRNASDTNKYGWILDLAQTEEAKQRIKLFSADLNKPNSFDEAIEGCRFVLHVASPYSMTVKDPQKNLVEPAVNGTRTVLESALKAGVQRVVLTSSFAAICDEPVKGHVYTEEDWNEKSSLKRLPYYYSKVLAEREAWKIVEENKGKIELLTINPHVVLGKSFSSALNESPKIVADVANGKFPFLIAITFTFVDVEDVAKAHILAMETTNPDAVNQRYLCSEGTTVELKMLVEAMKQSLPKHKLPTTDMTGGFGSGLIKMMSYAQPSAVGSFLRNHISKPVEVDNSKSRRLLGLEYKPWAVSVKDTVESLQKWGYISVDGKKVKI
uniref:3-beta hydroxysteroid dehydrogenase/isomerase domain-containing protein n=1 Tax=Percolomonas cosmopolitus TaxID=63605 RepID=A0A7S1PI61_9EUKA|mmetsp:Transcript_7228/g.27064  ORF Transcript_7228/g.27064 Transcript_7228/m.27064 type:complete len:448 (+) Transcript_7228:552-1895(+)|eukprot:CAMPEP_0117440014 /NCGR_PEP_ID=MMETSP0759-20121206/2858_1 /TAXON_ID=63605 /ORGANISM="Percolomonas cosmopolitus, Strain WS" /LENGTH=447 /DNA_ID=CAMNT_0005231739 /DNA_START=413 /DNA_END=1756 /DNA_ORIENTATION=-